MVANGLLEISPDQANGGCPASRLQHLSPNLAALQAITTQKRLRRATPAMDERQLPGKVGGILDPRIHSLSTCRTVDMGCIAGQEHSACTIVGDFALINAKAGEPDRLRSYDAAGTTLVQNGLHLCQGWIGPLSIPDVGDDPVSALHDGKDCQHDHPRARR